MIIHIRCPTLNCSRLDWSVGIVNGKSQKTQSKRIAELDTGERSPQLVQVSGWRANADANYNLISVASVRVQAKEHWGSFPLDDTLRAIHMKMQNWHLGKNNWFKGAHDQYLEVASDGKHKLD